MQILSLLEGVISLHVGLRLAGVGPLRELNFLRKLAKAKARSAPKLLQSAARHWWLQRWHGILAVAAQVAFAESLITDKMGQPPCADGEAPYLSELAGR